MIILSKKWFKNHKNCKEITELFFNIVSDNLVLQMGYENLNDFINQTEEKENLKGWTWYKRLSSNKIKILSVDIIAYLTKNKY